MDVISTRSGGGARRRLADRVAAIRGVTMDFHLSDVLGAILVLVGLYLVLTGFPTAGIASAGQGIWPILREIFEKYPRIAIGIILILIGALFLGVDIGPLVGGGGNG